MLSERLHFFRDKLSRRNSISRSLLIQTSAPLYLARHCFGEIQSSISSNCRTKKPFSQTSSCNNKMTLNFCELNFNGWNFLANFFFSKLTMSSFTALNFFPTCKLIFKRNQISARRDLQCAMVTKYLTFERVYLNDQRFLTMICLFCFRQRRTIDVDNCGNRCSGPYDGRGTVRGCPTACKRRHGRWRGHRHARQSTKSTGPATAAASNASITSKCATREIIRKRRGTDGWRSFVEVGIPAGGRRRCAGRQAQRTPTAAPSQAPANMFGAAKLPRGA